MKKIKAFAILAVMLVILSSCGKNKKVDPEETTDTTTQMPAETVQTTEHAKIDEPTEMTVDGIEAEDNISNDTTYAEKTIDSSDSAEMMEPAGDPDVTEPTLPIATEISKPIETLPMMTEASKYVELPNGGLSGDGTFGSGEEE